MIRRDQIFFDRSRSERHVTVLVVDSNASTREELAEGMRRRGWTCLTAASAHGAWEHVRGRDVALVVLEPVMRDKDGVSGMKLLMRFRASRPGIPVFCLTCHPHLTSREECEECGASDFDVRPAGSIPKLNGRFMHLIQQRDAHERMADRREA